MELIKLIKDKTHQNFKNLQDFSNLKYFKNLQDHTNLSNFNELEKPSEEMEKENKTGSLYSNISNKEIINKKNLLLVLFVIFLGILVPWRMINKVYEEMSPEGRYENYKVYIVDSVEKWVKDRDNKFYNEANVIYWYETPNKKGNRPMDLFPPFIYQEIKNALLLTFEEHKTIKEPDSLKKIISEYLDLKRDSIIQKIRVSKYE